MSLVSIEAGWSFPPEAVVSASSLVDGPKSRDPGSFDGRFLDYCAVQGRISRDPRSSVYLLPETGFDIPAEVESWFREVVAEENRGKTDLELREVFSEKTAGNLEAFWQEYLMRSPILPFVFERRQKTDGSWGIWSSKYKAWVGDQVSAEERDGVVKEVFNWLEKELVQANPGTVGVFLSPTGWSGLKVDYKESQTYVYRVASDGQIELVTIRSSMSLVQNEQLMARLSGRPIPEEPVASEQERIKRVVGQMAIFVESEDGSGFADVLESIGEVMEGENLLVDERGVRTIAEASNLIENRRQVLRASEAAEDVINRFKDYLRDEKIFTADGLEKAIIELGKTVVNLTRLALGGWKKEHIQRLFFRAGLGAVGTDLIDLLCRPDWEIAAALSQIGGCAGGGRGPRLVNSSSGSGIFQSAEQTLTQEKKYECCGLLLNKGEVCPVCGAVVG